MLPRKLVFVDVETTGTRPTYDRVIDVGIIRVEDGVVTGKLNVLVNPQQHLNPYIQQLTGITPEELEQASPFDAVVSQVHELLEDAVFVAHNVRFDYGFIKNELKRCGFPLKSQQLCTVKLSRQLYPEFRKHNLSSIIERFGFTCENRHRAYDDAHVLYQFYQHVQKNFEEDRISKALHSVQSHPSYPKDLDPDIMDDLPEAPGVYFFYDKDGHLLYIGKSKNIKNRVSAHFNSDATSTKQMSMCQKVASIDYIQTAGELGALLRESHLIKKHQPIYNRQLKQSRNLYILKKTEHDNGFATVLIEPKDVIMADEIEDILGIFRSKRHVTDFLLNVAKEHGLCAKILGIEFGNGACFSHKLGLCKGACVNKEDPKLYNLRFLIAFTLNHIKRWKFDEAVTIVEKNPFSKLQETFRIDKWCILENTVSENQKEYPLGSDYIFDMDTYKILLRYFTRPDVNVLQNPSEEPDYPQDEDQNQAPNHVAAW